MAGFPHHALDTYLPKLIRAGKRVAVCDQLEDPKKKRLEIKGKKGLSQMDKMVKRGITELVTPGVAMGDNVLNYKENNFLAAIHFGKTSCGEPSNLIFPLSKTMKRSASARIFSSS